MKIFDRLFIATALAIVALSYVTPIPAKAWTHGAVTSSFYGNNACGVSTIPWCIMPDGWSKVTATTGQDVLTCAGGTADTCVIAVDRNTAADFTASIATNTLNLSGSPTTGALAIGQTFLTGAAAGRTITAGAGLSWTISGASLGAVGAAPMQTIVGNDSTCGLQKAVGPFTTEDLSSFAPASTSVCATLLVAQGKLRNTKPDWMVLKKGGATITASIAGNTLSVPAGPGSLAVGQVLVEGSARGRTITAGSGTSWTVNGASTTVASEVMEAAVDYQTLSYPTSGNLVNKNGPALTSVNGPMTFWPYGTGLRPLLQRTAKTTSTIISLAGSGGNNTAWGHFRLYDSIQDPISPNWVGATIVGDTGTANGCATNTEICNITGGTPALIQAGATSYRVWGTGLTNVPITSATSSTVVFGTTVPASGRGVGVTYQLEDTSAQANVVGFTNGGVVQDFFLMEGMKVHYGQSSQLQPASGTSGFPNMAVRRNMWSNAWSYNSGACFFIGPSYPYGTQYIVEENVCNYGGINPYRWSGGATTQNHGFYDHDPSTGQTLVRNIVANGGATGIQDRQSDVFSNNLLVNNPISASHNAVGKNFTESYNVYTNGTPSNFGYRTAICAAPPCNSGTTLSFEGIQSSNSANVDVRNLSNPGSVNGRINISSFLSATSFTLTATLTGATGVFPGVRGDGVKSGDILQLMSNQMVGEFFGRNGTLLTAGPASGAGIYLGPSTVSVTAASPAVVTESGSALNIRVADEPFQFPSGATFTASVATNTLTLDPTTAITGSLGVGMVFTAPAALVGRTLTATSEPFVWTVSGASLGTITSQSMTVNQSTLVVLPSPLAYDTDYCSKTATNAYEIYLPTAGVCSGGTSINTTGVTTAAVRRNGTRKWAFTAPSPPYPAGYAFPGVPAWVTVGMPVTVAGSYSSRLQPPWSGQASTVAYIPPASSGNIPYFYSTDSSLGTVSGLSNGNLSFMWGGIGEPNMPIIRAGPNNVFARAINNIGTPSGIIAMATVQGVWGINAASNYIYNWSSISTSDNFSDTSAGTAPYFVTPPGQAAYLASNSTMSAASQVLTTIDNGATPEFPEAMIEAYDASLRGTTCLVTFAAAVFPATGSVGTVAGACAGPPIAGDYAFDASGSNPLPWATQVPPGQTIGSTFYIDKNITKGTPFAVKFGSSEHFLELALSQYKDTGWNAAYGANAVNNFYRSKLKCGDQTRFPGSPACPAQ